MTGIGFCVSIISLGSILDTFMYIKFHPHNVRMRQYPWFRYEETKSALSGKTLINRSFSLKKKPPKKNPTVNYIIFNGCVQIHLNLAHSPLMAFIFF